MENSVFDNLFPRVKSVKRLSYKPVNHIPDLEIVKDSSLGEQTYKLVIRADKAILYARDDRSISFGKSTYLQTQILSNHFELFEAEILDYPDFKIRGVMLDVSRDKVYKLETLFSLIERLALFKINQLHLYTEHTFAFKGCEAVHAKASPYSVADIVEIKKKCNEYGIDLVPNINTLGHLERYLMHDQFNHLAFNRKGFYDRLGMLKPPTTLNPLSEEAFAFAADLITQISEAIDSEFIHIGLDEPWELDHENPQLYINWLKDLVKLSPLRDRQVLIWSDYLANHPQIIKEVPKGVAVVEWGYESDHPFAKRLSLFHENSLATWVAPGTSSWLSIVGRMQNMVENIRVACKESGDRRGFLNTDWGDFGHLQPFPIAEPGLYYGAAAAWTFEDDLSGSEIARLIDLFAYGSAEPCVASAMFKLSSYNLEFPIKLPNMSAGVFNIYLPQLPSPISSNQIPILEKQEAIVLEAQKLLEASAIERQDNELIKHELSWAIELVKLSILDHRFRAEAGSILKGISSEARLNLASLLDELIKEYPSVYFSRNREGGFSDSIRWLENLKEAYISGEPNPLWAGPLSEQFFKTHPLPA